MMNQDLVITSIITAEEFWVSHAAEYIKQKQGVTQDVGVSGLLAANTLENLESVI